LYRNHDNVQPSGLILPRFRRGKGGKEKGKRIARSFRLDTMLATGGSAVAAGPSALRGAVPRLERRNSVSVLALVWRPHPRKARRAMAGTLTPKNARLHGMSLDWFRFRWKINSSKGIYHPRAGGGGWPATGYLAPGISKGPLPRNPFCRPPGVFPTPSRFSYTENQGSFFFCPVTSEGVVDESQLIGPRSGAGGGGGDWDRRRQAVGGGGEEGAARCMTRMCDRAFFVILRGLGPSGSGGR